MDEFTAGLDQSEADDADNIEYFGGTFKVGGAAFEISQTQGNELPSLKISAYDSVGTSTPGSGLQGRDFALDPIAGATQVEVASVRVFDENGNLIEDSDDLGNFDDPTVMIFLNNAGDELNAVVTGLDAKYTIEFETALVHDISLVEAVDGKFDIGAFRLIEAIPTPDQIFNFGIQITDNDGDAESATHSVRVDGTGIYNDDPLPIGTEGPDTLIGTPGDDELRGLGGDDLLIGFAGFDLLDGGADSDTVDYSASNAAVIIDLDGAASGGHATGDTLISIENLIGSAFADTLTGNGLSNVLIGGGGDDLIEGGAGADDIDGGADNDTASYAGSGVGVTVDLSIGSAAQTSGGDANGDTLTDIDNLIGSAFADTLTGDGGANVIRGGAGDDIIAGGADGGFDLLYGGAGADRFVLEAEAGLDIIEDFEDGIDMIQVLGLRADEIDIVAYSTTSTELRSIYGDRLVVIRNVDPSLITEDDLILGPTIEPIIGTENADTLIGTADGEEIYGLGGDDLIEGREGADTIDGGADTDTASYAGSGARVDVDLVSGIGLGGDAEGDTLAGIENLIGSAFVDTLSGDGAANVIDGGAGADTIYGNGGDDTLKGEGGDDLIEGGAGADAIDGGADTDTASYASSAIGVGVDLTNAGAQSGGDAAGDTLTDIENLIGSAFADTLTGDGGTNVIRGGAGDDIIAGGVDGGFDLLYGGAGADQFVLEAETGLDIIEDFEDGIDMIEVVGLTAAEVDIVAYSTNSTELRSIYGDRLVVVRNVDPTDITEADLLFT